MRGESNGMGGEKVARKGAKALRSEGLLRRMWRILRRYNNLAVVMRIVAAAFFRNLEG